MPTPAKKPELERKIFFYQMEVFDEDGPNAAISVGQMLNHVQALAFTSAGRYWLDSDGNATCCWPDRLTDPQRLRVGTVRRTGLPRVERAGRITALNLAAEAGLLEEVHVVFFSDHIVGAIFNFYGPRLSRLGRYLEERSNGVWSKIIFHPLLKKDSVAELMRFSDVRLLQLRIKAPYSSIVSQADQDLGAAFQAAQRAAGAEEIELILRPKLRTKQPLSQKLLSSVKNLAARTDMRESVSKFTVKGFDPELGKVDTVDLLSDHLISHKRIVVADERTRALDQKSAYKAVEDAYKELKPELRDAAGLPA